MTENTRVLTKVRGTGGLDGQVVESKDIKGDLALFTEIFTVKGDLIRRDGPYQDEDEADIQLSMNMDDERRKKLGKAPKMPRPY